MRRIWTGRRGSLWAGAVAAVAAIALAGCGTLGNTITAAPGTADSLTVALPTTPNANYIGIYEARALGYYRQADLNVILQPPAGGTTADQLPVLESGHVGVALSSEPAVLAARNEGKAVVSVAAVVQGPLEQVRAKQVKPITGGNGLPSGNGKTSSSKKTASSGKSAGGNAKSGGTGTSKSSTGPGNTLVTVYQSFPDLSLLPADVRSRTGLPTYNGLVIATMKGSIVNNTSVIRRFVQATARGYEAVRANPDTAVDHLIAAVPSLAPRRKLLLTAVKRELVAFFPTGAHPWGWQVAGEWNAFGQWMAKQQLVSTPNAIIDASTNELLAGQGV